MSALQSRWQQWSEQFMTRPRRERAIVAAALVFGGGFLLFNFGIDPALRQSRAAVAEMAAARAELTQQQAQLAALQSVADPDQVNRQRLARLKDDLAAVNARLAKFESGMVPPARMRGFLEDLLARNRGIELLELKTLPPKPVGAPAKPAVTAPSGAAPAPETAEANDGIWQHGIELKLAGSYNDLFGYLSALEGMPQRLMWNSVSLTVEKYPRNVLVLRVYTLSLDKNWLVM
jgi:MSHA biogenesis protein MshJ